MDQIDEPALSRRARRAVPLIAAALAVIVVASLIYLKATAPPPAATFSPVPYVSYLSLRYQVTYDFVSPSRGWALVVDQGFVPTFWVFGTSDGAKHWQRQLEGTPESGVSSIHFLDSRHGFAYAGVLYRTTDGGAYWEAISLPEGTPNFTFASPTLGGGIRIRPERDDSPLLDRGRRADLAPARLDLCIAHVAYGQRRLSVTRISRQRRRLARRLSPRPRRLFDARWREELAGDDDSSPT
jgi:hypothetical protein